MKTLCLCTFFTFGCAMTTPPAPECFDYSGRASWTLTDSTLRLAIDGDFIGVLGAKVVADTVSARFAGLLTAPLMQDSYTCSKDDSLFGVLFRNGGEYELVLTALGDTLEFYWQDGDDLIWYTGSSCTCERTP